MARKREKEVAVLRCGASTMPGCDWTVEIRLIEKQPGQYMLYHSNSVYEMATYLVGGPPWKLIAEYLQSLKNAELWASDIEGLGEFESSGLEGWQDTALFICWFREDMWNHGAQFRWLSDDEVRRVCEPYTDLSDYNRPKVFKLWNNLNYLSFFAWENPAAKSYRLKDVLAHLGCWDSPDPILAAVDYFENLEEEAYVCE